MWTLNWFLYEHIGKRRRFHSTINESLRPIHTELKRKFPLMLVVWSLIFLFCSLIITARKRSSGKVMFHGCLSVHGGGGYSPPRYMGHGILRDTGRQAGGTHPTRMLSYFCFCSRFRLVWIGLQGVEWLPYISIIAVSLAFSNLQSRSDLSPAITSQRFKSLQKFISLLEDIVLAASADLVLSVWLFRLQAKTYKANVTFHKRAHFLWANFNAFSLKQCLFYRKSKQV